MEQVIDGVITIMIFGLFFGPMIVIAIKSAFED